MSQLPAHTPSRKPAPTKQQSQPQKSTDRELIWKVGTLTDTRTKTIIDMLTDPGDSQGPSPTEQIIELLERVLLAQRHLDMRLSEIEKMLTASRR